MNIEQCRHLTIIMLELVTQIRKSLNNLPPVRSVLKFNFYMHHYTLYTGKT